MYIPLGGSFSDSKLRHLGNVMITFTVSGLWHGADWTFVAWGLLHGLYYIPLVLTERQKFNVGEIAPGRLLPSPKEIAQMGSTFVLTLVGWVFFRADSMEHAFGLFRHLIVGSWLVMPGFKIGMVYVIVILVSEWLQREKQHAMQIESWPVWMRWSAYYAIVIAVLLFRETDYVPFIYFQF